MKLQDKVIITELAAALAVKDVRRAMAILERNIDMEEILSPAATVVKDAVERGGRIGAQRLNEILR